MKPNLAVLLASVAMAGCFHPRFSNGTLSCAQSTDCPPGYHCALNLTCYQAGSDPDPAADSSRATVDSDAAPATAEPDAGTGEPTMPGGDVPQAAHDTDCREPGIQPEHGQLTCVNGAWDFVCDSGYKKCADRCVSNEGCCTVDDCPILAEGTGTAACERDLCTVHCEQERTQCGLACVRLSNDSNNCGSCDHACAASQICYQGSCAYPIY